MKIEIELPDAFAKEIIDSAANDFRRRVRAQPGKEAVADSVDAMKSVDIVVEAIRAQLISLYERKISQQSVAAFREKLKNNNG
jgi:hypothetical protein